MPAVCAVSFTLFLLALREWAVPLFCPVSGYCAIV